ncbi:MAG: sensor histidine kinase, partial [Micromonosporaceae bacterium]|nr:sensor histidine kinase [Micromonosporaceae bacterium]
QGGAGGAVEAFGQRVAATDSAVTAFRQGSAGVSEPAAIRVVLGRVQTGLLGLGMVRQQVTVAPNAVGSVVAFRYRALIAEVVAFRQGLAQIGVSESASRRIRAAAALSAAVEALSRSEVTVARHLDSGRLTPAAEREIVAADAAYTEAIQSFADLAPAAWRGWLNAVVRGPQVVTGERLYGLVIRAQPGDRLDVGTDVAGWVSACEARLDLLRRAVARVDADLLAAVTAERDARRMSIGAQSLLVGGVLLAMVAVAWWVARQLGRSLVALRARAERVAGTELPGLIATIEAGATPSDHGEHADRDDRGACGDHPGVAADAATVDSLAERAARDVGIAGRDEVGQVAEAFGQVVASAVRLAGRQAMLRAGISSMLVALSWRLQRRADAMMVSLDALERDEQDPDRLAQLFELDHVAALIRRLIANLQVLAGGLAGQPRSGAVELTDLLRAAYGEIDDYTRITLTDIDQGVAVSGEAAEEVIHLLAELLDNAVRFSGPDEQVIVTARRVGDRLHLQIQDAGTGMSHDQFVGVYQRLEFPGQLHRDATRQMGIPVVAAIAARLGIRIDYRTSLGEGTRVDLILPAGLITHTRPAMAPGPDDTQQVPALPKAAPPTWPPVGPPRSTASPTAVTGRQIPLAAPVLVDVVEQPPVIFEELRRDASCGWFAAVDPEPDAAGRGHQVTDTVPGWVVPSGARPAVAVGTTRSGLPRRHPGQRVVPVPVADPPVAAAGVLRRDPQAVRRRTAGFQRGRAAALYQPPARRQPAPALYQPSAVKEPSR